MTAQVGSWRRRCISIIKTAMQGESNDEELREQSNALNALIPFRAAPAEASEPMPVRIVSRKRRKSSWRKRGKRKE